MPIASFVITFREALEAALVVGIVAAYLKKVGRPEASRYLIVGAASAAGASVVFAWILQEVYGGLVGAYESLFEGLTALAAAGFLTYMIFWMTRNARKYKGDLERKLDLALTSGQLAAVAAIAFIAVFREGIETVLFLTAIFFIDPSGTSVGILLGLAAVTILAIAIMKSSYRLDLHAFFKYTSMILLVFAAGLVGFASHELAETAETLGFSIGFMGQQAFNVNVAPNSIFHEEGLLGSLLSALFGYTLSPEWIRLAVYLGYWVILGGYLVSAYRGSSTRVVPSA
jgi:high-affinity iron transporter